MKKRALPQGKQPLRLRCRDRRRLIRWREWTGCPLTMRRCLAVASGQRKPRGSCSVQPRRWSRRCSASRSQAEKAPWVGAPTASMPSVPARTLRGWWGDGGEHVAVHAEEQEREDDVRGVAQEVLGGPAPEPVGIVRGGGGEDRAGDCGHRGQGQGDAQDGEVGPGREQPQAAKAQAAGGGRRVLLRGGGDSGAQRCLGAGSIPGLQGPRT